MFQYSYVAANPSSVYWLGTCNRCDGGSYLSLVLFQVTVSSFGIAYIQAIASQWVASPGSVITAAIANAQWSPTGTMYAVATCLTCNYWGIYNLVVSGLNVQMIAYPTGQPSSQPTRQPSVQPSSIPSIQPSRKPTSQPSRQPSSQPSGQPTSTPTRQPSMQPSQQPTNQPTRQPTMQPTMQPSRQPTSQPSRAPSMQPTTQPTASPTTNVPVSPGNMVPVSFQLLNVLPSSIPAPAFNLGNAYNGYMSIDNNGNPVLVSNTRNFIVRVNATTGSFSNIAGSLANAAMSTSGGFSGDGGPATSALLKSPTDIAFDSAGNFYISDNLNYRIRKVSAGSGYISTVAGTGVSTPSGDGSLAILSSLSDPMSVRIDGGGGMLYFSERGGCKIRKISLRTGQSTQLLCTTYFIANGLSKIYLQNPNPLFFSYHSFCFL